jgi:hypothetical protein
LRACQEGVLLLDTFARSPSSAEDPDRSRLTVLADEYRRRAELLRQFMQEGESASWQDK